MNKPLSVIQNLGEFDGALREIGLINAQVARADVDRQNDIITAEGKFAARTKVLVERRDLLAEQMELYYRANRSEIEKKKKSIELRFGRAGIKISAPSLRLLKGWNWEKVLGVIPTIFIRTKQEVDKQALKKANLSDGALSSIGVKMHQTETFFYETYPQKAEENAA
ncbi:MAG TPA: host-nuclease inhibitor Gam family protein [Bryobacteraceae bacterium]|nr:host-nuclease inhibitor Gam family protein [Bryobacteraceae bacterium]